MPSKRAKSYYDKLEKSVGRQMAMQPGVSKVRLRQLEGWPEEKKKIDRRADKYKRRIK